MGVILKGRNIVIPEALQGQALEQLHGNHMAIEKKLVHESKLLDRYETWISITT